jgi:hypothetical protein
MPESIRVSQRLVVECGDAVWVPPITTCDGIDFIMLSKGDRMFAAVMGCDRKASNPFRTCGWFEHLIVMRGAAHDKLLADNEPNKVGLFVSEDKRSRKAHEREETHVLTLQVPAVTNSDGVVVADAMSMRVLSAKNGKQCLQVECNEKNMGYVRNAVMYWQQSEHVSAVGGFMQDESETPPKYRRRENGDRMHSDVQKVFWNYDRRSWFVKYNENGNTRTKCFTPKHSEDRDEYDANVESQKGQAEAFARTMYR